MSGLKIITVWDSISNLSIANLTIKDIDAVSEEWQIRGSVLYPDVANPITISPPKRQSFGIGTTGRKDILYTLNYRLLYAPAGSGRGIKDIYAGMFAMVALLFNAIVEGDPLAGSVDIVPKISSTNTTVLDPAGNSFYGLDIAFDVTEFYEV